jgi:hypothetical protein
MFKFQCFQLKLFVKIISKQTEGNLFVALPQSRTDITRWLLLIYELIYFFTASVEYRGLVFPLVLLGI